MKHLLWYYPRKCAEPKGSLQGTPRTSFYGSYQKQVPGIQENAHLEVRRKPILALKSSWGHKPTATLALTAEGNEASPPSYLQTVGQRSLITKTEDSLGGPTCLM